MQTKRNMTSVMRWSLAVGALFVPATLLANVTLPHTFVAGTPIKAAEVNQNFDALNAGKEDSLYGRVLTGTKAGGDGTGAVNNATTGVAGAQCSSGGTGLYGESKSAQCGAYNWAGVYGHSTAPDNGVGVLGASESGTNGFGVAALAGGTTSVPLLAYNGGTSGAAIDLYGGAIRVDPASKPMAFIHKASAANSHVTCIDNPLTNNDPKAIVQITHNWTASGNQYWNHPTGIYYETSNQWCIFTEDTVTSIAGQAFNVVVFKSK